MLNWNFTALVVQIAVEQTNPEKKLFFIVEVPHPGCINASNIGLGFFLYPCLLILRKTGNNGSYSSQSGHRVHYLVGCDLAFRCNRGYLLMCPDITSFSAWYEPCDDTLLRVTINSTSASRDYRLSASKFMAQVAGGHYIGYYFMI